VNGANGSATRAKPQPPAPPAKRPAAGRKPAPPPAPRDSGMSMNGSAGSGTDSGRNTPTPSLAGGLAEALRARQNAMQKERDAEDGW
jgi:myosin I